MISSMTGYGEAEGRVDSVTYAVELRTVNNRYFKAKIKLPEPVAFLEEDIEKLLRKSLSRGMVDCVLRLRNVSANVLFDIDETALQAYMERLSKIACSVDIQCPIDISGLLSLPGIIQPVSPDKKVAEQIRKGVLDIAQQAIEKLKEMRRVEGAVLAADLEQNCKAIGQDIEQIRARAELVLADYARRLRKRADELLAEAKLQLDEPTLAREVAVFAERSDISEELTRLDSHLRQFTESCASDTQAGRKLDFICQEMLREANTIASKASDTEIIRCVVDIKCRIDRIKEQVQNVE